MFWLQVKGPVYWKHASFLMFGFLSLFSPFCFSQSALPRAFKKDMELKPCLRVKDGGGAQDQNSSEWCTGHHLHVGRLWTLSVETPGLDELCHLGAVGPRTGTAPSQGLGKMGGMNQSAPRSVPG